MQGILDTMVSVIDSVKAGGSYLILLLASLYLLYRLNAKKNQWSIYYVLMCLLLVCINPAFVMILSKAFPVLGTYSTFILFAPVLFYIPLAAVEVYEKLRDSKQLYKMLLLLVLLIGISGNLYGLYKNSGKDSLSYGKEQQTVIELVREENPAMLVADESILPFIRIKVPEVSLLYGRDLYQPGMDLGIIDGYSEELLHFYEAMKNPEDTIEDILATADLYGCDMVIVKQFENAPETMGHYEKRTETGEYIIYSYLVQ